MTGKEKVERTRLTFRTRLLLIGLALQLTTLLVVGVVVSVEVSHYLEGSFNRQAEQLKPLLRSALAAPMMQRDYATVEAIAHELLGSHSMLSLEVCDQSGGVIFARGADGQPAQLRCQPPEATQALHVLAGVTDWLFAEPSPMRVVDRMELDGQSFGSAAFTLSRDALTEARREVVLGTLTAGALMSALVGAFAWLLSSSLTRPLNSLLEATRDIRAGKLDVEVKSDRSDEFGMLMRGFERMRQELRRRITDLVQAEALQSQHLAELRHQRVALDAALSAANSANEAKSTFISHMSHELRTPLNSIIGLSEYLATTGLSDAQREHLRLVQASGEAMLHIANDVLDFSRMSAGHLELRSESIQLQAWLQDVVWTHLPGTRAKGLALTLEVDPGTPQVVRGDAARLRQVLDNLIANAVKFTDTGGIEVRLRGQPAGALPDGSDQVVLHFEVRDTGIGIAAQGLARLFEPFAQADQSITRRFGGIGLGLVISRRLARAMGGDIEVESSPDQGSRFSFVCPAAVFDAGPQGVEEAAGSPAPAAGVPTPVGTSGSPHPGEAAVDQRHREGAAPASIRWRVLVVDDTPTNRLVIKVMLERAGHYVSEAGDGEEGIERWKNERFDVVLMDLQMPVLDGVEAARRIRQVEAQRGDGSHTPILAVTANAMEEDVRRSREAGMDGHLAKPVRMAQLLALIERVIEQPCAERA